MDTDASDIAISGILQQWQRKDDGSWCLFPIAYMCRVLTKSERNYGAPKLEMLAVVTFMEHFKSLLHQKPFIVRSDNQSLSWLKTYSMEHPLCARWITKMEEFQFTIEHRPRKFNEHADGFSKRTQETDLREREKPDGVREKFNFMSQE